MSYAATEAVSRALQDVARSIEQQLKEASGELHGFTLLVFTDQVASYVSNVDRATAREQLRHLLELWDAGMPDIPAHERQN